MPSEARRLNPFVRRGLHSAWRLHATKVDCDDFKQTDECAWLSRSMFGLGRELTRVTVGHSWDNADCREPHLNNRGDSPLIRLLDQISQVLHLR